MVGNLLSLRLVNGVQQLGNKDERAVLIQIRPHPGVGQVQIVVIQPRVVQGADCVRVGFFAVNVRGVVYHQNALLGRAGEHEFLR